MKIRSSAHLLFGLYVSTFSSIFGNVTANSLNTDLPSQPIKYKQWFTGPVLTPTPITMPVGHPGLEVAWLIGETYGYYNSDWQVKHSPEMWSTGPYIDFQVGFNSFLGAEYIGALLTNFCKGKHHTHLTDSILRLGFQVSTDQSDSWIPDFRILFQETFPTGKYQKLKTDQHRTDLSGQGSFQTGIHLAFQKLFHPFENHDFRLRWTFGYFVPASLDISGISYLGGTSQTKGKVYPGQFFIGYLCGEYALSRRWALCVESSYEIGEKGSFTRQRGPKILVPAFRQITIAPEIQHTFSPKLGLLMGAWLSIAGKNAGAFRNYFISVLYSF